MIDLSGFFAALPTPFSTDGATIEATSLAALVARNIDSGLNGLYVGGSTGEAFLMSEAERETLLCLVAEAAAGRCTLIAHVGDPNPAVSARLADCAASAGYQAVSAVPPFYYRYGFAEIREHYRWLAGRTELPFVIYNFPELSGVRWSVDELAELLTLPNIVGVKNTCGDVYAFEQLRRRAPESILLHGFDETLLSGLALGADGGIGSTYNIQASRVIAIAAAHRAGRPLEARTLQAEANELIDTMVAAGVLPALKFLLERTGIPMGPCRRPFRPLSDAMRGALERAADRYLADAKTERVTAVRG